MRRGSASARFARAGVVYARAAGTRLARAMAAYAGTARIRFASAGVAYARTVPVRRAAARIVGVHLVAARSDRGSATVWSVGAIAVLCVVFGGVLAFGQAVVVRHRAAGGADLAALAAADHWADGPGAACARAEEVARAQGTRLVRCGMVGEISDVTAASGRGPFTAEIRARAGPAVPVRLPVPEPPQALAPNR